MVSSNEAGFDLRETSPLPRNILHNQGMMTLSYTGQRADSKVYTCPRSHRSWLFLPTSPKVPAGYLKYPAGVRDTAKSGIGHTDNRHLNYLAESISVNVGGSQQDVKASSLPMSAESVGGAIVLGARESRVQGEGHQEKDAPLYSLAASPVNSGRTGSTTGCERERDDKAESNPSGGMSISGEPDAVKVASPARRGE